MQPTRDVALLIQAQAGDQDAYAELQGILEPELRRFVRRLIQHSETEDDIVQEIFIKFYTHLAHIHPPQNLRPYVFRIARNACYDELRTATWTESLDDEPVEMYVSFTESAHQPRPDDLTHWMLLGLEVRLAIDQLPETQRQTLILASEEGMSYAEIAQVMGVGIGTVKSRLFYAKKNLRAFLKPATLAVLDEEFSEKDNTHERQRHTNTTSS